MTDRGYRKEFSAAVTVASSTIGPIIPPSIMFIIYAVNMNVSIGQLFVAGVLPGFLIALILMATVWVLARTGVEACPPAKRSGIRTILASAASGAPAILTPVIIVLGMVTGVATATEAAVLAVLYSLFLGILYREMSVARIMTALKASIRTTALIMYLTGIGAVMAFVLTSEQAAEAVAAQMLAITEEPWLLLLLINFAVLVLGCVLETLPALLIAMPLFGPIALDLGMSPLQFGVVLTFNLLIGIITPPVGIGLYAVCAITGLRLEADHPDHGRVPADADLRAPGADLRAVPVHVAAVRAVSGHLRLDEGTGADDTGDRRPGGHRGDRHPRAHSVMEYDLFGYESSCYPYPLRFDMQTDARHADRVAWLFERGYGDRMVIAHDVAFENRLVRDGGHGCAHIIENVVPLRRK